MNITNENFEMNTLKNNETGTLNTSESLINQTEHPEELSQLILLTQNGKIRLKELIRKLYKRDTEPEEPSDQDGNLDAVPTQVN